MFLRVEHRVKSERKRELESLVAEAKELRSAWAKEEGIPLHRLEYMVPFVDTSFSLAVWFFYKTDAQLHARNAEDGANRMRNAYLDILRQLKYPVAYLSEVEFHFDSHEKVKRKYDGNYCLYFR